MGKATSSHAVAIPAPKCLQLNTYLCAKLLLDPTYDMGANETAQASVSHNAVVTFILAAFIKYIYIYIYMRLGLYFGVVSAKEANITILYTT